MLDHITWKEYWIAVSLILIIYYLVIVILYYKENIRRLLSGKWKQKVSPELRADEGEVDEPEDAGFQELEAVVADLRSILERAGKTVSKEELLRLLRQRLTNYTGLRKPAYRVAVHHAVIQHAQEYCGVTFREEELDEEW